MRIELNYLVEYQHETNAWTHFLCISYMFKKHSILFNCFDSFGCIYTTEIKLDQIKKLTIKPIGENKKIYSYNREEQKDACNED